MSDERKKQQQEEERRRLEEQRRNEALNNEQKIERGTGDGGAELRDRPGADEE